MLSFMDYEEEQTPEQAHLYETCLKGSRDEIKNYCQNGDISTQYMKNGLNPLHVVAIAGRADAEVILDMMLQNGFDVNSQTKSSDDTVLHLIVEHVNIKDGFPLVLKILEYGPDLQARNRKLRTPYDIAIARGEYELAKILDGQMTTAQAKEFYQKGIGVLYGNKLIDAVLRSNEDDIAEYLKLGADPNHVNEHKNGAIHYAITHCKVPPQKTLFLLIQADADVNLQDDEGDTALNLIIKSTKLRESGDMYTCAEMLVKDGALSTFQDLDGRDALALARQKEYADIVRLLTETRPQHTTPVLPDVVDDFDHPVPRFGEEESEPEPEPWDEPEPRITPKPTPTPRFVPPTPTPTPRFVPPLLREPTQIDEEEDEEEEEEEYHPPPNPANAAQSLADNMEDTPELHLIRATREGTLDDVNHALSILRADPNKPDDVEQILTFLAKAKVEHLVLNKTGIYPIHHVCIRGEFENEDTRLDMLRALIEAGADINQPTVNSESSALHIAATNNQEHVAQLLLDTHKCNYNAKTKLGKTAYEVAEDEENQEVMDVLHAHRQKVRARLQKAAKKASFCSIL